MSSHFKLCFESSDPAVSDVHDKARKEDQDPAAQPNPTEGSDPTINQVTKAGEDPAITNTIKTGDDPTLDKNTEIEGVDVIDSVAKALAVEALAVAIEDEIGEALDASDQVDGLIEVHKVASGITEPTETEKRLIQIADSLAQGTTGQEPVVVSQESFGDVAQAIADKIVGATKSISDSISNIYSAFVVYLKRVGSNFRTFRSQLTKLRSMVHKLAANASKQQTTLNVKNDKFLYTGSGQNSTDVSEVKHGDELSSEFSSLCTTYDKFAKVLGASLLAHQKRYIQAFTAIFETGPTDELFFNELKAFDDGFLGQLRTGGDLTVISKVGDSSMARNSIGLGGTFFSVVSPSANVYTSKNVDTVLKTFDTFHFGPESTDFKVGSNDRELMLSIGNLASMVDSLEKSIDAFEGLSNVTVFNAMMELNEFSEKTFEGGANSSAAMKSANTLARLQVLEARVVIEGYLKTYYGIVDVIEFVNRFIYNIVSQKAWYEQDIGLS